MFHWHFWYRLLVQMEVTLNKSFEKKTLQETNLDQYYNKLSNEWFWNTLLENFRTTPHHRFFSPISIAHQYFGSKFVIFGRPPLFFYEKQRNPSTSLLLSVTVLALFQIILIRLSTKDIWPALPMSISKLTLPEQLPSQTEFLLDLGLSEVSIQKWKKKYDRILTKKHPCFTTKGSFNSFLTP